MRTPLPGRFPDHQGKYRVFGVFWAQIHRYGQKSPRTCCGILENSLEIGTGMLIDRIRELNVPVPFPNREFIPWIALAQMREMSRDLLIKIYRALNELV